MHLTRDGFSIHTAIIAALAIVLFPAAACADNLGAIGQGAAVLFALAVGLVLVIGCIVFAIMLGRWITKPSRVSGFVLVGISGIFSLGWLALLATILVSGIAESHTSKDLLVLLAWGVLGGGLLSIAPIIVVVRSIRLSIVLLRRGDRP